MSTLWQEALKLQREAIAAQARAPDPARALADTQEIMRKAAEANMKAWADWAKLWGIE